MSRQDAEKRPRGFVVIPLADEGRAIPSLEQRTFDIVLRLRISVGYKVTLEQGEACADS